MEANDGASTSVKHLDLSRNSTWCAPVVVIPMTNDVAGCPTTTKIALLADAPLLSKMDETDSLIVWNEVPNVLPVREDQ